MNEVATVPQGQLQTMGELPLTEVRRRKLLVHDLMREQMIEGHHFGTIPGTDGKSLLKPGAEMLAMMFRLMPQFDYQLQQLENGHREYRVTCTLTAADGSVVATGLGSCSTMESKYRWRRASQKCPECGAATIRKGRNGFFCGEKLGGCGKQFSASDKAIVAQPLGKIENPDIADQWNAVLKIAAKRAQVHAVLLATAASDMFVTEEDEPDAEEEPKLSAKEQLIRDCLAVKAELEAGGFTRDGFVSLFEEGGVPQPKRTWGELTEEQLSKAKGMMSVELKKGVEAKS